MSIRRRLRQSAESDLQSMVEQLERKAIEICQTGPVDPKDLCRLATGDRKTLMKKVVTKLADQQEERILRDLANEQL